MKWTKPALKELEKAPAFVRDMAKKKVEDAVTEKGKESVSLKDVQDVFEEYMSFMESDPQEPKTNIAMIQKKRLTVVEGTHH